MTAREFAGGLARGTGRLLTSRPAVFAGAYGAYRGRKQIYQPKQGPKSKPRVEVISHKPGERPLARISEEERVSRLLTPKKFINKGRAGAIARGAKWLASRAKWAAGGAGLAALTESHMKRKSIGKNIATRTIRILARRVAERKLAPSALYRLGEQIGRSKATRTGRRIAATGTVAGAAAGGLTGFFAGRATKKMLKEADTAGVLSASPLGNRAYQRQPGKLPGDVSQGIAPSVIATRVTKLGTLRSFIKQVTTRKNAASSAVKPEYMKDKKIITKTRSNFGAQGTEPESSPIMHPDQNDLLPPRGKSPQDIKDTVGSEGSNEAARSMEIRQELEKIKRVLEFLTNKAQEQGVVTQEELSRVIEPLIQESQRLMNIVSPETAKESEQLPQQLMRTETINDIEKLYDKVKKITKEIRNPKFLQVLHKQSFTKIKGWHGETQEHAEAARLGHQRAGRGGKDDIKEVPKLSQARREIQREVNVHADKVINRSHKIASRLIIGSPKNLTKSLKSGISMVADEVVVPVAFGILGTLATLMALGVSGTAIGGGMALTLARTLRAITSMRKLRFLSPAERPVSGFLARLGRKAGGMAALRAIR